MKKQIILIVLLLVITMSLTGCFSQVFDAISENLTRGTVEDHVYESEYAGLTFKAPNNWVYSSDEDIAELMGVSAELYSDSGLEFDPEILEKQSIYDMMVMNQATGTNVIIMYENLAVMSGLGLALNEEAYIDVLKEQLEQAQVFSYEFSDIKEAEICSESFKLIEAEMTDYGITQYYYARRVGKYMLGIIISVFGDDEITDIMENFS